MKGVAHVAENTTCLLIVTHSMYDVPGSDLYLQTGHLNLQMYVVLLSLQANTLLFCGFILYGFLNTQGYPKN